jgi:outer membrane protein TolC
MRRGSAEHRKVRQVGSWHRAGPARRRFIADGLLATLVIAPLAVVAQTAAPPAPLQTGARVQTPEVSDPMLAPAPPAGREIGSWEQALRMVRAQAPDYLANYQRVRQAEARSRIAVGRALPVIDAEGTFTHQFFTDDTMMGGHVVETPANDVFGVGATARVPIVDLRVWHGLGTGERNERAEQLSFAEQRRQIAIDVVQTMLSTLAAARVAELNRQGLRAALERLALAQARLQYGQGTALDVDRAQQDVAAARAELISGDESLQAAREALGLVLGSEHPLGAATDLDLAAFERAVATTCRLHADIERRSDVAAARARLEVAERLVDDAELQYLPSLDLRSELRHATKTINGPNTTWSVLGVLSVPIYDGARYGVTDENRALAAQARQALIATRLNAIVAVARAQRAVKLNEAARAVALEQRELARRIDERIRQGYAGGIGTSLDLVISAQSLRLAETRLTLLDFELGKARAGAVLANAECMY